MKFHKSLIDALPWEDALRRSLPSTGEFFPSRSEALAARTAKTAFLKHLQARLEVGRTPSRSEIVPVPRASGVTRPALDIGLADRVILAALASKLVELLEPHKDVTGLDLRVGSLPVEARRTFERRPMEELHEDDMAVVTTDVAAFYEYVDHETLTQEVVELTAEVDLSGAMREALGELQGRDFGLPQGPRGSDVFADLYLGQVERALSRAGWSAYRLRDEFVIPVRDRDAGRRALLDLEQELRLIGLSANPGKTDILDREPYISGVTQLEGRLRDAIVEQVSDTDPYAFDPEALEEALKGIDWEDLAKDHLEELFEGVLDEGTDEPASVANQVLAETLPALGAVDSDAPLDRLAELVDRYPHMTRETAFYLRLLGSGEHADRAVREVEELLLSGVFLFPWTTGWLFDVLARTSQPMSASLIDHLEGELITGELPWFALGRAVIALARAGAMPDQQLTEKLFAGGTVSARADITAAVRASAPDWRAEFESSIGPDEPLLRAILRPRKPRKPRKSR